MQFTTPLSTPPTVVLFRQSLNLTDAGPTCETVAVPAGATALLIGASPLTSGTGTAQLNNVVGVQSGIVYEANAIQLASGLVSVPINPGVDSSYTVCFENSTVHGNGFFTVTIAVAQ